MFAVPERIHVAGVGLETRWIGPGPSEAVTLVLLHDGPAGLGEWGDWADRLARVTGCGVFLYSRAGSGCSDAGPAASGSWLQVESQRVLPQLLDAIGLKRGILLGHGHGASVATAHVGGVEDHRIRGLILLAPHFFDPGAVPGVLDGPEPDLREFLGYVRVPILVVQGTADPLAPALQREAASEETYCPVDLALVEGARSAPHLERGEETLKLVSEFVRTLIEAFGEGASLGA